MPIASPERETKTPQIVETKSISPLPRARANQVWLHTTVISAVFIVIVALGMIVGHERAVTEDPLRVHEIQALREKLHNNPKDEALKEQIRQFDLQERKRYFARVRRNTWGAWMLLTAGAVFVLAGSQVMAARRRPPIPRALTTVEVLAEERRKSRLAVIALGTTLILGIGLISFLQPKPVAPAAGESTVADTAQATAWSPELARQQWPRFRGADGSGVNAPTSLPLTWNLATGENVAWKSAVPLPGPNSPVIWGERVFLTGSDTRARELFCFDANDGALLWRLAATLVSAEAAEAMDIPKLTGAAAATAAADAERVFAIFATGELIAADHQGRLIWSKNFGKLANMYGHAASLLVWRDRLILQLDQGDADAGKSRLYAFNSATGEIIWQQRRMLPSSWTTPVIIDAAGREQIICVGEPWLISYDARDGTELWRFGEFGSDLTPSPIFAGGLVFAISPNQELFAIRPDGRGDVSKTHRAWSVDSNIPDIASPVGNGELLFTLESHGNLVCYEAASGAKLWEHAYDGEFNASPAIAGDRLYLMSMEGDAIVIKVGREFQELARNHLGETVKASPAFVGERMFVRGVTNLFCIAATSKEARP